MTGHKYITTFETVLRGTADHIQLRHGYRLLSTSFFRLTEDNYAVLICTWERSND